MFSTLIFHYTIICFNLCCAVMADTPFIAACWSGTESSHWEAGEAASAPVITASHRSAFQDLERRLRQTVQPQIQDYVLDVEPGKSEGLICLWLRCRSGEGRWMFLLLELVEVSAGTYGSEAIAASAAVPAFYQTILHTLRFLFQSFGHKLTGLFFHQVVHTGSSDMQDYGRVCCLCAALQPHGQSDFISNVIQLTAGI